MLETQYETSPRILPGRQTSAWLPAAAEQVLARLLTDSLDAIDQDRRQLLR
jgi:hypothetical protein